MKIEIWSDIVCPFCYIGKRKFEAAMAAFPQKDAIEVEWKSFQLDPDQEIYSGKDIYTYLAEAKGQTREWSLRMHEHVKEMAREAGLDYRFDTAKATNTFDAHRVIQLAKKHRLGDKMEERIFRAYFTEGELVSDPEVLASLASEVGLDREEVASMLAGKNYAEAVHDDMNEAARLGARGVPFFVINRKYGISGAQDSSVFLQALSEAFEDWKKSQAEHLTDMINGQVCAPGSACE